jgi:hypothetical protein
MNIKVVSLLIAINVYHIFYRYTSMNLPQNGFSQFVGTMKFPLLVAFIVSKPIGTQLASVQPFVCTMNSVVYPRVSRLWEKSSCQCFT